MRRSTSTIKRVQDLLSSRRTRRFERRGDLTQAADARGGRVEAESRHDSAMSAGKPVPPLPPGL